MITERPGLRERKKEATIERLRDVALELFYERGFDAVSVDDIADEAEVSKTTFYRYFPSKEDVLLGRVVEHHELVRAAFESRPLDEPPVEAARHAFRSVVEAYQLEPKQKLKLSCVMKSTPSLAAGSQANQARFEELLREQVGRRLPDAEPFDVWVLSAEILGAVRAATSFWMADDGERDLSELVDAALDRVAESAPVHPAR